MSASASRDEQQQQQQQPASASASAPASAPASASAEPLVSGRSSRSLSRSLSDRSLSDRSLSDRSIPRSDDGGGDDEGDGGDGDEGDEHAIFRGDDGDAGGDEPDEYRFSDDDDDDSSFEDLDDSSLGDDDDVLWDVDDDVDDTNVDDSGDDDDDDDDDSGEDDPDERDRADAQRIPVFPAGHDRRRDAPTLDNNQTYAFDDVAYVATGPNTGTSSISTCACLPHYQTADALHYRYHAAEDADELTVIDSPEVFQHRFITRVAVYQNKARAGSLDWKVACECRLSISAYSVSRSEDGRFMAIGGDNGMVGLCQMSYNDNDNGEPSSSSSGGGNTSSPTLTVIAYLRFGHTITTMCNSLRFGSFLGVERLYVASQDGVVALFGVPAELDEEIPPMETGSALAAHGDPSVVLGRDNMRRERARSLGRAIAGEETPIPAIEGMISTCLQTFTLTTRHSGSRLMLAAAAILLEDQHLNCAEPVPSTADNSLVGRFVAVVCDEPMVWILSLAGSAAVLDEHASSVDDDRPDPWTQKLDYPTRPSPSHVTFYGSGKDRADGCQYCKWSPDARFLTACCDKRGTCAVWRVRLSPDGRCQASLVAALASDGPMLPAAYHPGIPDVVLCAEERWRLWSFSAESMLTSTSDETRFPTPKAKQLTFLPLIKPPDAHAMNARIRFNSRGFRITGLAPFLARGRQSRDAPFLAVSTETGIWCVALLPHVWTPEVHHRYPRRFRDAVRELLTIHTHGKSRLTTSDLPSVTESVRAFDRLPREVLHRVFACLSLPACAWTGEPPESPGVVADEA